VEAVMMKAKVEVVANVVVILLAVVIGSVFLKDRFAALGPQPNEVKAGDRLIGLDGWDWGAHDRTLLLVLRKGCHFCEDSAPFYQRLVARQQQDRSNTAIVGNAREFKLDSQVGTIEPGKIANLVLLKKSPLESVDAYDSIVTVWVHGRPVSRGSLAANSSK
jgi:hypothetical protein